MIQCTEVTYDASADALYISLACGWSAEPEELKTLGMGGVMVDVLDEAIPIGIEVLGASRHPAFSHMIPRIQGTADAKLQNFSQHHAGHMSVDKKS
jgi:uncharacterized protein YuzE